MVLLIIIPFLNGYFIGNIPYFQTNPMSCLSSMGRYTYRIYICNMYIIYTGRWFQTLLLFSIIYGMSSFPLTFIFFKIVKTTNQYIYIYVYVCKYIFIYVHIHVYIYKHMYVYLHLHYVPFSEFLQGIFDFS